MRDRHGCVRKLERVRCFWGNFGTTCDGPAASMEGEEKLEGEIVEGRDGGEAKEMKLGSESEKEEEKTVEGPQ